MLTDLSFAQLTNVLMHFAVYFLARDVMQKRGNSYRTVSIFIERDIVVFLSVCPSNAGTVSK